MTASILFVGESPPAGSPANFRPFDCDSGTRLASVLGLVDRETLLRHVPMANLFASPCGVKGAPLWDAEDAQHEAVHAINTTPGVRSIVALGRRVADAFDMPAAHRRAAKPTPAILTTWRHTLGPVVTYAPHPSGASTVLNSADNRAEVRRALLPELVLGCPDLRPWHFRLDDPGILADLAVAVAPLCPAVGAAALLWARAQHVARQARLASPLLARVDAALAEAHEAAPGWDHGLDLLMLRLLQTDGARSIAGHWARDASDRFLLNLADNHAGMAASASRAVIRATTLRYMLAEMQHEADMRMRGVP